MAVQPPTMTRSSWRLRLGTPSLKFDPTAGNFPRFVGIERPSSNGPDLIFFHTISIFLEIKIFLIHSRYAATRVVRQYRLVQKWLGSP